ncbi:MotA/TolQ/ExbB proton channel family protein [Pyruvatibacter sp.]|uniref:motility protein A n=1 Tax=Pyruvatibacter sp. TaxID=1981328 RepID=UPI003267652D
MRSSLTAIIALIASFALLAAALTLEGNGSAFLDVRAALIVFGGTLAVTMISFSPLEVIMAIRETWSAIATPRFNRRGAADRMLKIAERTRKDGLLGVERLLPKLRNDPFLSRALAMLVDGIEVADVERMLEDERLSTAQRRAESAEVLRRAADIAPAMGLIGTLVGLVQMLGQLNDPAAIGPAMAVALLTTFYGAVLGTMVLSPLAAKLDRISGDERDMLAIYTAGAAAIGRKDHPRQVEHTLNALLPEADRVQYSR